MYLSIKCLCGCNGAPWRKEWAGKGWKAWKGWKSWKSWKCWEERQGWERRENWQVNCWRWRCIVFALVSHIKVVGCLMLIGPFLDGVDVCLSSYSETHGAGSGVGLH
jgi:hypothetical protein